MFDQHVLQPECRVAPGRFHFNGPRQFLRRAGWLPDVEQWIGGKILPIHKRLQIAHGEAAKIVLLQIIHVFTESFRRRVNPRVGDVRHAVKLQHDDLSVGRAGHHALEMFQRPVRVGIAGGGNQQGMMTSGIVGRANVECAVARLRLLTATGELVTKSGQLLQSFRTEGVAAICEAPWARHLWGGSIQFPIHQGKFPGQARRVSRLGKVVVRPAVIPNLETHRMNSSDVLPRHEVGCVVHPAMRHKKRRLETQLLEQRRDESAMRLDRVIEGQNNELVRHRLCSCSEARQLANGE